MRKLERLAVLGLTVLAIGGIGRAADQVAAAPATPVAPATQPAAMVSEDARKLLDEVSAAYGKLHSLNLAGTIKVDLQVEGSPPEHHSADFTASFVAPNQFRHEVKDDVLVGSTGQKVYTFMAGDNAYTQGEAPKDRAAAKDLPKAVATLLTMQDPSLLLAISKNPADELLSDVSDASKVADIDVGGTACPTLKLTQKDKTTLRASFDPQSHLLRELQADMTSVFKQRRPDFAIAVATIDYGTSSPDADAAKDETFAWSPPPGAKDADATASARPLDDADASELEGKAAPQFKLDALEGKPVSLSDLNGKVVVLDFWATWCGPCRASLPHLNKMYDDLKEKGLQVFALDQQEDKQDVAAFVAKTKLTVPVLLDSEGKVGEQYGVKGIPQTVIIGKDGKIKKVIVGFGGEEGAAEMRKLVEAAMKE
jgi:peroxiredoxin